MHSIMRQRAEEPIRGDAAFLNHDWEKSDLIEVNSKSFILKNGKDYFFMNK